MSVDLHPAVLNAFIGLIAVVLVVLAWRSVARLPAFSRWVLRLVLAAAILGPFALIVLTPRYDMARAPSDPSAGPEDGVVVQERSGSGRASPDVPNKKVEPARPDDAREQADEARRAAAEAEVKRRLEAEASQKRDADRSAREMEMRRRQAAEGDDRKAASPPPASPAPEAGGFGTSGSGPSGGGNSTGGGLGRLDPIGKGAGTGSATRGLDGAGAARKPPAAANGASAGSAPPDTPTTRSADRAPETAAPAPSPVTAGAGEEKEDWTLVPVYYGTDRARLPNDKRVDYGADRGRRLELGRALVTVPKLHEVPQVERPWAITIPYFKVKIYEQKEDPKKHFTMQELKTLSEAELLALVKERLAKSARYKDHAFVFVHGYNTSFDFAVYRAAQIAYDIKFDGAPFVYSWPSGGGIASYTYDRESAAQAESYLTEFMKLVTQKTGAKHVSVIAHSMGNQLLLRVLQDLQRTRPPGVEISQIIFAAPDVDRDAFETIALGLKDLPKGGITLYTAANDRALEVSRRFHGGIPRAGDVPATGPLVMPGIDTIDATAVSMDSLGLHHSGYAESNALLQDIGLLIQTGERPPGKRVPILKPVTTERGQYWRYPGTR